LEIDRIRKTATLIKAGAAPTVVIRDGKSVKLESRTPPAGIMKNVIADKKVFKIEKGDLIVMLSDGVLQTGNDFVLLPEKGVPPMPSARALATTLVREARRSCETADDMSVCVLRIY
jgi:stage II sporulation protein E